MASYRRRGDYQWQARVRRKGYPDQVKTFEQKADAVAWARQIESEMDNRVFVSRAEAESTSLYDLLGRYEREIVPGKRGEAQEKSVIRAWQATDLAKRPVAAVRGADVAKLRDDWLKDLKPATVLRRRSCRASARRGPVAESRPGAGPRDGYSCRKDTRQGDCVIFRREKDGRSKSVKEITCVALALVLAACAPASDDPGEGVLQLLTDLGQGAPLDAGLVERTLQVKLLPRGNEMVGKRPLARGQLSTTVHDRGAVILLPGKLPEAPCVLAIGQLLDHVKAQGYATDFYDLGSKPAWSLTKDVPGGRSVGLTVMTNPPTKPGERAACVGYLSAGTEATDGQTVP